jgi:hypothetical protein
MCKSVPLSCLLLMCLAFALGGFVAACASGQPDSGGAIQDIFECECGMTEDVGDVTVEDPDDVPPDDLPAGHYVLYEHDVRRSVSEYSCGRVEHRYSRHLQRLGSEVHWHSNGALAAAGTKHNGRKQGPWVYMDEEGKVVAYRVYLDGEEIEPTSGIQRIPSGRPVPSD